MTPWLRFPLFVVVLLGLSACGNGGSHCDGPDCEGSNLTVLRSTIGLDLANVESFAVVDPEAVAAWSLPLGTSALTADQPSGAQLYALTLSGEILEVIMVESTESGGVVEQPLVDAIFPTATWVLFSTPGYTVDELHEDGSSERVDCYSIAARRADGALYCGSLGLQKNPNAERRYDTVQSNAAGDVVYSFAHDPNISDKSVIYKITLDGEEGPSAALAIDPWIYPQWFLPNASGDLFVVYFPSALDHTTSLAQIVPIGGGSAVVLEQTGYGGITHGKFGEADEDTFYTQQGQDQGTGDELTVWAVTKDGAAFVETPLVVSFPNASMYGGLFQLEDGLYMVSAFEKAIVRALENGVAVANPTPIPFNGVDHLIEVRGGFVQLTLGQIVMFVSTGTGYKFVRHDGTTQQDIPIDPNIEVLDYTAAPSGAIDFLGRRADTQEKVRGTVAAGETMVIVESGGILDPAQMIVFTRIN